MFGLNRNFSGFLNVAKAILGTALGVVQSRVELFSAELQEERQRFVRTILLSAAVVIIGTLALALFTATIIVAFWEIAGAAVLGGLALLYCLGTVLLYRKLDNQTHNIRPLSRTIEELKRDRECLGS